MEIGSCFVRLVEKEEGYFEQRSLMNERNLIALWWSRLEKTPACHCYRCQTEVYFRTDNAHSGCFV